MSSMMNWSYSMMTCMSNWGYTMMDRMSDWSYSMMNRMSDWSYCMNWTYSMMNRVMSNWSMMWCTCWHRSDKSTRVRSPGLAVTQ